MEVSFSPAAIADLTRIRSYIAAFNPIAAQRMIDRLIEAGRSLATLPNRGRPGVDGTRELTIVPPYILVYEVRETLVRVHRIWHGAQDR